MSQTGAGGNKDLTETDGGEATSDVDHFDELDIDIKLEEEEESDDQTNDEGPKVITIKNSEKLGGYVMCDQCPARLKSMVNLERHMRNKHAPTTFCCSKCDKTFDNKKKLDDHERTHQTEKCPKCDKSISSNNFSRHQKICKGPVQMLQCDQCPFQTKRPHCLKNHKSKHTGHICETCYLRILCPVS